MRSLFSTVSLLGLAVCAAAPASAQVAGDNMMVGEEIVVTGFQLQNRTAISAKRDDIRIADFLTQDELGRQPDLNVADSLRRLPGVITVFDEDEGRYVGLRGLDPTYTFISIDGGLIASTDRSDRDINIESIPPTAVKRLEVFKSVTPDLDGQSVGGVINLVTRSAFDADGLYAVANAQVGTHSSIGDLPQSFSDPSFRVDGAISNRFANGTIGVLLAGTYFDKKRDQGRPLLGVATNDTGTILNQVLPLDYANQIKRWNLLAKVEFQPTPDLYASITASHFNYKYEEVRYRLDIFESGLTNQTATTGQFTAGSGQVRFDRFPLEQKVQNLNGHVDYVVAEKGRLELTASYSRGLQEHPEPNASFRTASLAGFGYSYDFAGESFTDNTVPTVTLNDPSVLTNYDAYLFTTYSDSYFENEEKVYELQGDFSWNTKGPDAGLGFKVGAKFRQLDKGRFATATNYRLADPSVPLSVAQFVDTDARPYTADYFVGLNYPLIDPDAFEAFFAANPGLFVGVDASNQNAFYDINEQVLAGYGLVTYNMGPHAFLAGVRYERTDVDTQAALNGTTDRVSREFKYDHLLPSALYTFSIGPDMRLRAGYAQAIGRPNHPELAGAETFDEANRTIRRANTNIKPRESKNFDVGFDWFIEPGQFFSAALFYKIIDNQISSVTTEEVINGLTFQVTQPINIDKVKVGGLEFSYADDMFDFLPAPFNGLGINANLTLLDGKDGPAPGGSLIAQPDFLFNVAGLYTYGPFSGKLTYNYVDDRPTSSSQSEYRYEQLDLQLRYQVLSNLQVQVEGRNILNAPRKNFFTATNRLREINDFGNSWWLGVSYKY